MNLSYIKNNVKREECSMERKFDDIGLNDIRDSYSQVDNLTCFHKII